MGWSDLYNFFSNYISVLDRIAHEIDILSKLQVYKVDWMKFFPDKNGNYSPKIYIMRFKHPNLFSLIDVFQSRFGSDIVKYHNRYNHDGLLNLKNNNSTQ